MSSMKIEDFDRKKKYWKAFWEKEVLDRPLISVKAPLNEKTIPVSYLEGSESGNYMPVLQKVAENAANTYYGGEAVPFFECSLGPDQFASFLGGKIEFSSEAATSWVHPFWDDDYSEDSVKLDTGEGSYFRKLMDFIKTAADFADGRFLIGMLDLHTNMDALMAARGSQNLCMDLADDPERVKKVLDKVVPLFPQVVDAAARAGNMDDNGFIGWAPTFCEERFAVLQCDFSIMINPEMTRQFVVPALEYETSCLKHNVYHYDGPGALSHLDDILAIKAIDVIQWVPGDGQPRTIEWMDLLKKIQKAGKGLWLNDWTPEEIKTHFKELSPKGLYFDTRTKTPKEADELIAYLKKNM